MRSCKKTACHWPAAASLSYRYDTRQAWLLDLADEPDPSLYDLCPHHADNLKVMNGWERVDQRTHADPVVEPAGRDLLPGSGHPPVGAGGYGGNRYNALVDDLPRVAAELAEIEANEDAEVSPVAAVPAEAGASAGSARVPAAAMTSAPVPSRDLAPMPAAEAPAPPPVVKPAPVEVPGQLAIPVDHADHEQELGEAVVVSITSGRRRTSTSR